ncbi:ABC transporter permease [Halobacillus litoralis]|uniref:ABC transporter permease n=1 Tax=Halobacillus litoralis TaxID=45668 RepID=UPI001CFE3881|nr:ABC transporter permease subunit [Halobacillus litoralis]
MQWLTLYKKECLESARNFKWIWVPLVFILLCITDPLSTYYLPLILESTGGLPEGAVIEIPTPLPFEVFMMSISQLNLLGILVIALITMGTISGERKDGVAELILVKPVSYFSYITAKWTAYMTLILSSTFIGFLASWYYIELLFGDLSFTNILLTFLFFGIWLMFVVSISIFMNTSSKLPGIVLFLTLGTLIAMNLGTTIFSTYLEWSPSKIVSYLPVLLNNGYVPEDLWFSSFGAAILSALFIFGATLLLKRREMV